jgi:hypothetical protein
VPCVERAVLRVLMLTSERTADDGTSAVPKHVGDLLTSGVCMCVCVCVYIYIYIYARNLKLIFRFFTNEKRRYYLTET